MIVFYPSFILDPILFYASKWRSLVGFLSISRLLRREEFI